MSASVSRATAEPERGPARGVARTIRGVLRAPCRVLRALPRATRSAACYALCSVLRALPRAARALPRAARALPRAAHSAARCALCRALRDATLTRGFARDARLDEGRVVKLGAPYLERSALEPEHALRTEGGGALAVCREHHPLGPIPGHERGVMGAVLSAQWAHAGAGHTLQKGTLSSASSRVPPPLAGVLAGIARVLTVRASAPPSQRRSR